MDATSGAGRRQPPTGFYAALSDEEREAFGALGRRRRYPKGSSLFSEGERAESVMVLRTGRVKISWYTEDGRESVLAVRGPGDLLGELAAIDGEPRSATVTALEPVEAVVLSAAAFRGFLETHPKAALALLEILAGRLRDADRKRIEFGAYDAVGRVARRLVELADRFGQPEGPEGKAVRVELSLTQDDLAGWVGASRKATGNALAYLRARGIIETRRRGVIILDLAALRRRAG
jgi:CRP/FNR family cyclic AMP-dependent transcriptional regulator